MEPIGLTVSIHRYRVLFADGEVQDFLAALDGSNVRAAMLKVHYSDMAKNKDSMIMGIVDLGVEYEHHPGQERLDV